MIAPTNILVTGVTGFVGRALFEQVLKSRSYNVTVAVRAPMSFDSCSVYTVGDIHGDTDWSNALVDQHVVIHAAGRTHIMSDEMAEPLAEYRRVNVNGTLNLARQAAEAGVSRFVFVSSIKVNGEETPHGLPFTSEDIPAPEDPYAISKWEAELGLRQLANQTGMEVVIIRPPLVYGPGVKGNFAVMIKLLSQGLPLPLGAIHNRRSLVALDNLVDLVIICIDHPAAADQVFLAGDGTDLSTTELLRGLARAKGISSRLIPVPSSVLIFVASLLGKKAVAQRLLGSLQVDISQARDLLGWEPSLSVAEGLKRCFE